MCSSVTPRERGSYRLITTSRFWLPSLKNWLIRRFELRSSEMPACVTRKIVKASLKRVVPIRSSLDPTSTTTFSKFCSAMAISLSMASLEACTLGTLLGAASTDTPERCLTRSLERKLASRRPESRRALSVEYSATMPRFSAASPMGRPRSINNVLWPDSWARATAKLQATVVTPEPPLAPRNTSILPWVLFSARVGGWTVSAARSRASLMVLCLKGRVRYSRAPARMHRTTISRSAFSE